MPNMRARQHSHSHSYHTLIPSPTHKAAMPAATSTTSLDALSASIPSHFQEAQSTLANHRKNTVALFKLHSSAATHVESTARGLRLVGEKAFNEVFLACVNRVLGIKKGVVNADRAIKFAATYSACKSLSLSLPSSVLTLSAQTPKRRSEPRRVQQPRQSMRKKRRTTRKTRRARASSAFSSSTCCAALAPRTRPCVCAACRAWHCSSMDLRLWSESTCYLVSERND